MVQWSLWCGVKVGVLYWYVPHISITRYRSVMYPVLVTPITPSQLRQWDLTKARWMPLFSFQSWFPLMAHPFQRLLSQPQTGPG